MKKKEETPMKKTRAHLPAGLALLCLILLLPSLPGLAEPVTGTTPDGFKYEINGSEAAITGYEGHDMEITIPGTVQNVPVTSIGDKAFFRHRSLKFITIPTGVKSIGNSAFDSCESMTGITIPNTVKSIGNHAFYYCISLTALRIPDSVNSIGNYAFQKCRSLTYIAIPHSVHNIGYDAFSGCTGLKNIYLSNKITEIQARTFMGCTSLASITIPPGVTVIGFAAFSGCASLKTVFIPKNVTSIGVNAFASCSSLTSVTILPGVAYMGDDVFANSPNVIISGYTHSKAHQYAEANHIPFSAIGIVMPDGFEYMINGDEAILTGYTGAAAAVTIPDRVGDATVTGIGLDTFLNHTGLTSVAIPDSVRSIGDRAFAGCSNLSAITLKAGVKIMGADVFKGTPVTIYGYRDSEAHIYATANNTPFVALDDGGEGGATLPGDANNDKSVDIRDLVSIINFIVSGTTCDSMQNADANGDGYVDIRDLVWIINRIVSD